MHAKFPITPPFPIIPYHQHQRLCKIVCCAKNSSSSDNKNGFKLLGQSFAGSTRWKLNDIDSSAMQETLNIWVSKTQSFLTEVTSPLVKNVSDRTPHLKNTVDTVDMEEFFMAEQTIDSKTPRGDLSLAAIVSVEQFSRYI